MTPPVRPEPTGNADRITRRIDALRQQGATDHDIEAYLTQVEGLKPVESAPGGPAKPTYTNDEQFGGAMLGGIPFGAKALAALDALNALLPKRLGGEGALSAPHPTEVVGQRYTATRDRLMGAEQAAIDAHPVAGRAVEMLTGAVPFLGGGAVAGAPAAATRLGRAVQGAKAGAKMGAVYGALEGAGRATGGVGDYASRTTSGALTGGATGGALGGLLSAALPATIPGAELPKPGAVSPLRNLSETGFATGADATTVQVPRGQRIAGPESADNTVSVMQRAMKLVGRDKFKTLADAEVARRGSAAPEAQQAAVEETARRLVAGEQPPALSAPVEGPGTQGSTGSEMLLLRALQERGMSLADAQTAVDRWRLQGSKPQTLIELLGKQGTRLGRAVRTASPKAGEHLDTFLEGRSESAVTRAIDDALEASGIRQRSNGFRTRQQFVTDRATEAEAGYKPAFADAKPIDDPRVQQLMDTPAGQSAWKRALRMMKNRGVAVPQAADVMAAPEGIDPAAWENMVKLARERGLPVPEGPSRVTPTLQQLHYWKLALDDEMRPGLNRGEGAGGIGYNEGQSIRGLQKQLLGLMDEHSPAYKAARARYADQSALIDAQDVGMNLFKMHPEEFEQALSEMGSEAERQTARRAGLDALARQLENGPEDPMRRAGKSDATINAQRIRLLFPDEGSYNAFRQRVMQESQMVQNHRAISGGSQTADKLADLSSMLGVDVSPHDLASLATGRGRHAVTSMLARKISAAAQGVGRAKAEALAPDLTAAGPDAVSEVLQRLGRTAGRINTQRARTAADLARAAGVAGSALGTSQSRRKP